MDLLVFGAGSLGSLIGGPLSTEHDVTLIGSEPHMAAIRQNGLRITGEITCTTYPKAGTALPDSAVDLAIVTVKSFDTQTAAKSLATADIESVLSLQNGMGNEELLSSYLACPVLAGTVTYGAIHRDPGVVSCSGTGTVTIGSLSGNDSLAAAVGDWFRTAGIHTDVSSQIRERLWEKLAVNAGINPTTALARAPNGSLSSDPLRSIATHAAHETVKVARSSGIALTENQATRALREVIGMTAENYSSMYQDVAATSRTEIDAINGYVVDHASSPVPVNETLSGLIRGWERFNDLR